MTKELPLYYQKEQGFTPAQFGYENKKTLMSIYLNNYIKVFLV